MTVPYFILRSKNTTPFRNPIVTTVLVVVRVVEELMDDYFKELAHDVHFGYASSSSPCGKPSLYTVSFCIQRQGKRVEQTSKMTRNTSTRPIGRSCIARSGRSSARWADNSKRKNAPCSFPPFELPLTPHSCSHLGDEHTEDGAPSTAAPPFPRGFVSRQTSNRFVPFPPSLSSFASLRTSRSTPFPWDCGTYTVRTPTLHPPTPPSPLFSSSPQCCLLSFAGRNCGSSADAQHAVVVRCTASPTKTRYPHLLFKRTFEANLHSPPSDHFHSAHFG